MSRYLPMSADAMSRESSLLRRVRCRGDRKRKHKLIAASKTQQPQSRGRNAHVTTVAPELLLMDEENSDEVYYIIITKALDQDGYYTRHDTDGCVVYPAGTTCIKYNTSRREFIFQLCSALPL